MAFQRYQQVMHFGMKISHFFHIKSQAIIIKLMLLDTIHQKAQVGRKISFNAYLLTTLLTRYIKTRFYTN